MAELTVSFNHFPAIAKSFQSAIKKVVAATATKIQVQASINAPEESGFLASSIYTVINGKSTYGTQLVTTSGGGRRRIKISNDQLLPQIPPPPDAYTAYAAVGAYYAAFVNYGHRTRSGSFVAANPFWDNAVTEVEPLFISALQSIEQSIEAGMQIADASAIVRGA